MGIENNLVVENESTKSLCIDLGRGQTIKAMVDKLYAKEKKFVYAKRSDECVLAQDVIFDLSKSEKVCPTQYKKREVVKET